MTEQRFFYIVNSVKELETAVTICMLSGAVFEDSLETMVHNFTMFNHSLIIVGFPDYNYTNNDANFSAKFNEDNIKYLLSIGCDQRYL